MTTKEQSRLQELQIQKALGGTLPANSGGTKFGGGDILTKDFLIEAKTTMSARTSFSVKKEWLDKAKEQAFEQHRPFYALAFQFEPGGANHYIINETLMKVLIEELEKETL